MTCNYFLLNLLFQLALTLFYVKTKKINKQNYCTNCGLYGFCLEKVSFISNLNNFWNKNFYKINYCTKCICPQQFLGDCCEEAPHICSDKVCLKSNKKISTYPITKTFFEQIDEYDYIDKPIYNNTDKKNNFLCNQISPAQNYYECLCKPSFTGPNCEKKIDYCSEGFCNKYGTLLCYNKKTDANCICKDGYMGKYCERKLYEYCYDGECVCEEKEEICKNNGICFYNGEKSYKCRCNKNFFGKNCERENICSKNKCKNGGICLFLNYTSFKCECPNIWFGQYCENFNACVLNLCKNKGKCIPTGNNKFKCNCVDTGFTGELCDQNIDNCKLLKKVSTNSSNNCQLIDLNAKCIDRINSYTCLCSPQFTGKHCETSIATWNLLNEFPGLTEKDLIKLVESIKYNPLLINQILPFFIINENLKQLSWDYDDLFIWASFQGQELNLTEEIVRWNNPSFGNCFTFNHIHSPIIYNSSEAGQDNGFEALLKVNENEYLQWVESSGLIIFFHLHDEFVFADSQRYFAATQTGTQFVITEEIFNRIGGLYGKCIHDTSEVILYYYSGAYTLEGCLQSCLQNAMHLICGCTDPRLPSLPNVKNCTVVQSNCVLNITKTFSNLKKWQTCECAIPCKKTDIKATVSYSKFIISSKDKDDDENFIKISVYLSRDYKLVYNELANMDFNRYISFFGGVAGVVAGFSIISVVEFGFLIYRLLLTFCTNESVSLDEAEVQNNNDDLLF